MAMEFLDINDLASLQAHLSSLTALYLSLYDEKGNVILPPVNENRLLTMVRSSSKGRDDIDVFLKKNIENTSQRNEGTLIKGPGGQYYFFMPLRVNGSAFTVVGGGAYLAAEDFENFYKKEGQAYGLSPNELKSWQQNICTRSYSDVQAAARLVNSIFNIFLRNSYKGGVHERRYRLLKTVLGLLPDIKSDSQASAVYDVLVDLVIFLFNADSVSIMVKEDDVFKPRKTGGRLKDHLLSIPLRINGLVSEVVEKQRPVYSESVLDILKSGFNDKITSIYLFPIISDDQVIGILNIFNSVIREEDADLIASTCTIAACTLRLIKMQDTCNRCLQEMSALNAAAERLISVKDPDMLYEAILDTLVHLTEAEKGSLMLADEDASCLTMKAAKGINKRLFGEISIRAGEGIAGWVFREGMPLMVEDIEKSEWGFLQRPKYRTGSFISTPLKIGDKTAGVLNISDKITGEMFSEDDMAMVSSFASYASIALERSNYYSLAGRLRELSITDSLTGLFNRRYFEERFFEELHRSERHNLSFSLAMLDIDDFKLFNDTEGHPAGDEILKYIANIAKDSLRVIDVIARFGGEEFAVIMPQTEMDDAFLVAERIRRSIKEQLPRIWSKFPRNEVTVSIGIALFPSGGKDRKELLRNADKALYTAKMQGKDRCVLWGS